MHRKHSILIYIFLICMFFFISCTSIPIDTGTKTASYKESENELTEIMNNNNLTPIQKMALKHAITNLKQAQKTDKQVAQLQKEVVKKSTESGEGKAYNRIIGFIIFIVGSYFAFKILKKFSIF